MSFPGCLRSDYHHRQHHRQHHIFSLHSQTVRQIINDDQNGSCTMC